MEPTLIPKLVDYLTVEKSSDESAWQLAVASVSVLQRVLLADAKLAQQMVEARFVSTAIALLAPVSLYECDVKISEPAFVRRKLDTLVMHALNLLAVQQPQCLVEHAATLLPRLCPLVAVLAPKQLQKNHGSHQRVGKVIAGQHPDETITTEMTLASVMATMVQCMRALKDQVKINPFLSSDSFVCLCLLATTAQGSAQRAARRQAVHARCGATEQVPGA